jgi:hypothetical protein
MPLLLAVAALVAAGLIALRAHREALHSCRTSLLATQRELANGLRELLQLNPEADRLRKEVQHADLMAQQDPEPYTRTAWAARAAALRAEQIALDLRQRAIIAIGQGRARAVLALGRETIPRAYQRASAEFGEAAPVSARAAGEAPRMRLARSPPLGPAPHYAPAASAEREQVARLSWSVRLAAILPGWMPLSNDSYLAETRGQCASTVKEKEGEWQPRLAADKP